jgi:hypothetical protein
MEAVRMTDELRYGINDDVQQASVQGYTNCKVNGVWIGFRSVCTCIVPRKKGDPWCDGWFRLKLVGHIVLPRRDY